VRRLGRRSERGFGSEGAELRALSGEIARLSDADREVVLKILRRLADLERERGAATAVGLVEALTRDLQGT